MKITSLGENGIVAERDPRGNSVLVCGSHSGRSCTFIYRAVKALKLAQLEKERLKREAEFERRLSRARGRVELAKLDLEIALGSHADARSEPKIERGAGRITSSFLTVAEEGVCHLCRRSHLLI